MNLLIFSIVAICLLNGFNAIPLTKYPSTSNEVNQRPGFHFSSPKNWLNDPNGPIYYNGFYHLFYQHNPLSPFWGDIYWGHAVSEDLLNWIHLPIALSPDSPYDDAGVWSGSSVIDDTGKPFILYTGVSNTYGQVQCAATPVDVSDPLLLEWSKSPLNPIIQPNSSSFPYQMQGFRDPTTPWRNFGEKEWNLLVGTGFTEVGGVILHYKSMDLIKWRYVGPFYSENRQVNNFYECPDFYELKGNNKSAFVLKWSSTCNRQDFWSIGKYQPDAQQPFDVAVAGSMDYGVGTWYASKSFLDNKNPKNLRRLVWGWLDENDGKQAERGWAGVQALREVSLSDDMLVTFNPIKEMESLRANHTSFSQLTLNNQVLTLKGVSGDQLEIIAQIINYNSAEKFGINVRTSPGSSEKTSIVLSNPSQILTSTDLPGSDYAEIILTTHDPKLCQTACDKDVGCACWTYLEAGVRDQYAHCFLKNPVVPQPTSNPTCTSGIKSLVGVDRSKSSLTNPPVANPIQSGPFSTKYSSVEVRIVLDHSVVEVYVNQGRNTISSRIYPSRSDSLGVEIFSEGGSITFSSVDVWQLKSTFVGSK